MPRARAPTALGKYRTVSFPQDVDERLEEFAVENTGGSIAEALRLLVTQALGDSGSLNGLTQSLEDAGYNQGLRLAGQDAKAAIAATLNKLYRK